MPNTPHALRPGDRVAVVSPAGPVRNREWLELGIQRLRAWGLDPVCMPSCLAIDGYLAGDDDARAADLQNAVDDSSMRAIWCSRGGYGALRIVDRIDWSGLRRDPKPLVGYSDITVLLAAAWRATGVVGFHGPMVATSDAHALGTGCEDLQRRLLFDTATPASFPRASADPAPRVINTSTASASRVVEGTLVGGNLALVAALLGTPWQIDTTDCLVFLEDVDESPYRVDRMLTQLRLAGCFERARGVLLGDFHYGKDVPLGAEHPEVQARLVERLGDLPIPVTSGWPFGHRPASWTLPYGASARLDPSGAVPTLTLLDPSVR